MISHNKAGGFTLVEVPVVLAVLGLVGGLVLAQGPQRGGGGLEMRAAAGAVTQALQLARTRAIACNRPVTVLFDTRAGTLRLDAAPSSSLPSGIAMAVKTSADRSSIQFLPDGSSSGGKVELVTGGRRILISVDRISGRVSVAEQR